MHFLKEGEFERPKNHAAIETLLSLAASRPSSTLYEHEVYSLLELMGIGSPAWHFHPIENKTTGLGLKLQSGGRFVAKAVVSGITHKTEIGGIVFNVKSSDAPDLVAQFEQKFKDRKLEGVLFVRQIEHERHLAKEFLIGLYEDQFFGQTLGLGFGGTSVEYLKEIMLPQKAGLFLPADWDLKSVEAVLRETPVVKMLEGSVRGHEKQISYEDLLSVIKTFQIVARYYSAQNPGSPFVIEELEVNPAVVCDQKITALDGVVVARKRFQGKRLHKPLEKIRNLLDPKTVAIAGASGKNPANPANIILKKFLNGGMPRDQIFLIHPKEDGIEGLPCRKNLKEMLLSRGGEPVDCLIVGVPARIAGQLVAEAFDLCAAKSLQIISAGFGETRGGEALQEELRQKLDSIKDPIRRPVVNGPNTLGNIYHSTNTLFTPPYKSSGTGQGKQNAALICQSGAFMITRISDLAGRVAPKIAVSVGNQMDLSVTDFFEYLLGEDGINAYGLYIEGLKDGDGLRLMKLVEKAKACGKFAVIYKAGRTAAGMEAAKGHTAAMAGDYSMFANLLMKSGALVAETFVEFGNLMMLVSFSGELGALSREAPHRKLGLAVLSNAGFEKCALADHLTVRNPKTFQLAKYSPSTMNRLAGIFKEHGMEGIIDIGDVLDLSPMMDDEGYEKIIRTTLEDENVDFGIFSIVPDTVLLNTCEKSEGHNEDMFREGSILNRLINIKREVKKPFVVSFESGCKYDRLVDKLHAAGIVCFRSADSAARVVSKCLEAIRFM